MTINNEFGFVSSIPSIDEKQDAVQLELKADNTDAFEAADKAAAEVFGQTKGLMGTMANLNATAAKNIFADHENVNTVSSAMEFGGQPLQVETHRQFVNGEGEMVTNYTSATMDFDLRESLNAAVDGIFED